MHVWYVEIENKGTLKAALVPSLHSVLPGPLERGEGVVFIYARCVRVHVCMLHILCDGQSCIKTLGSFTLLTLPLSPGSL